jgi:hypothetical protein
MKKGKQAGHHRMAKYLRLGLFFYLGGTFQGTVVGLINAALALAGSAIVGVFLKVHAPWRYLFAAAAFCLIASVGLGLVGRFQPRVASLHRGRINNQSAEAAGDSPGAPAPFVSPLPIRTIEEAAELAARCAATSKGIYAFLNKTANRTDDAKVLAEYRQRFETKVSGLYTDSLAGGMSPPDRLAVPAASRDDMHWIAHTLGSRGESYSAERLGKLSARAMLELGFDSRGLEESQKQLAELQELEPFFRESPGSEPATAATFDEWMERKAIPDSTRGRMRETFEELLERMDDKALPSERVIVDVSPAYLVGLFKDQTAIQAEKLTEAYRGQWMKVSGPLGDVLGSTTEIAQVTFRGNASIFGRSRVGLGYFQVFMYFDRGKWDERLAVLRPGSAITVLGRIGRVNRIEVHLGDCELVDA